MRVNTDLLTPFRYWIQQSLARPATQSRRRGRDEGADRSHFGLRTPLHILYINPRLTNFDSEASVWARRLLEDLGSARATVTTLGVNAERDGSAPSAASRWSERIRRTIFPRLPDVLTGWLIELNLFCRALCSMIRCAWSVRPGRARLRPDVVYARTFEYDWSPWLVARALKCPMVLEVHSPFYLERRFRGRRESKLMRRFDRGLWRRASRIRVVSKPVKTLLSGESIDPGRISFIPCGLDAGAPVERPDRGPGDPLKLVFVASFYPWHGADVLLTALAMAKPRLAATRLTLIGDGMLRPACESQARELGIEGMVEFTGWLSWEEMVERLEAADLAVAPYLKIDPFYFDPVKILEYMAYGLAIVASDIERIAEILESGRAGVLVEPGDPAALAETIVALAGDAPRRRRLGDAARDIIARDFSRQGIVQDVIALCEEAASGSSPKS